MASPRFVSAAHSVRSIPSLRSLRFVSRGRWIRDARLLLGMCLLVGGLALLETFALWCLGARYIPPRSIRKASVAGFDLSADGRWGVSRLRLDRSGTFDQSVETVVCLHDFTDIEQPRRLQIGSDNIAQVALNPSGDQIAWITGDGSVQTMGLDEKAAAPQTIGQLSRDVIGYLSWSRDGEWLVAVGIQLVYAWRMSNAELVHTFPHQSSCKPAVCLSSDSRHLLITDDHQIRIWSLEEAACLKSIQAPLGAISAVLTSDGRTLVVNSRDHGLCAWDLEQEAERWRHQGARWPWTPVALTANENRVASVERRQQGNLHGDQVVIRCLESGSLLGAIDVGIGHVTGLTAAPDGTLIVWSEDGLLACWEPSGSNELWRLDSKEYGDREKGHREYSEK